MDFEAVKADSQRYPRTAYIASVSPSGTPYVSPVTFAWHGDVLLTFLASTEAKVKNCRANNKVAVHFAVSEATNWDSCVIWGTATVVDDTAGRRELWDKMGYNCDLFEPGGPEADSHVFLVVEPTRARILRNYGIDGRDGWSR